jgi:hypothetical protein
MHKKIFMLGVAAFLFSIASARAAVLPFENAYTVASVGSTTPVNVFDIDGPAPVLFLDLPGTSFFAVVSSDWFHDPSVIKAFSLQQTVAGGEKFWLTPSTDVWDVNKAVGEWNINAGYQLVGLICLENGGICAPTIVGSGTGVIHFSVAEVPEPELYAMMGAGLALLGLAARRRKNTDAA